MKLPHYAQNLGARSILVVLCIICTPSAMARAGDAASGDVTSEIRSATSSWTDQAATNPRVAELIAFYEQHDFQPVWSGSAEAAERARQVEYVLTQAGREGLRSENYPVVASDRDTPARGAAAFDLLLTASLLRYSHDVRTGRVDPGQIYRDVALVPQQYDALTALSAAIQRGAIADYLNSLPPTHPGYLALANALARYGQARDRTSAFRAQQIAANMERWRWLPRTLESRYIAVDVPDQSLEYIRDGQPVIKSRVIIGRPDSPTPILRTTVQAVIANPSWDIPDDIAARMISPHNGDAGFLAAKNIAFENGQYRQAPGPQNVLGRVMLDAPNPFWVYMHDTPNKTIFQDAMREVSNGCVRVQQILPLASLALTDDTSAGMPALQQAIGQGDTQRIPLSSPLPVYMLYWTARADGNGNVAFSPDRYGRDPPLIAALGFQARAPAAQTQRVSVKSKPAKKSHF